MRLYVKLLEGKELGVKDSYVKVKIGKSKSKTKVIMNTRNPVWNEEFVFKCVDLQQKIVVSVHEFDELESLSSNSGTGAFIHTMTRSMGSNLVGCVKIPLSCVAVVSEEEEEEENQPIWFSLEKKHKSNAWKSSTHQKDCAYLLRAAVLRLPSVQDEAVLGSGFHPDARLRCKILLALSLYGKGEDILSSSNDDPCNKFTNNSESNETDVSGAISNKISEGKHLLKTITGRFKSRLSKMQDETQTPSSDCSSEVSSATSSDSEDVKYTNTNSCSFEELLETMQSVKEESEGPENLQGGVLVDMTYVIAPKDLNMLLFAPNSQFARDLAEAQGTTDVEEQPWIWKSDEGRESCLTRTITYTKPATKLVKAYKAIEVQTYVKVTDDEFAVFVEVTTPDIPYGNTFKVNLLYKMSATGHVTNAEEESTHLVVSWAINFHQHTMFKSMVESGARQGLKDSFDQFTKSLAENVKVIQPDKLLDKDSIVVSTLEAEHGQSDWELAIKYFRNWTVVSALFMVFYVFLHIMLYGETSEPHGLEFYGIDLPDSFGQIITCGLLFIQLQRVFNLIVHFVQARFQRRSDHGVKAQGEGWVLTIALVEGMNIASPDSSSAPDPYVVMTCNGKTRTSSVKLQAADPEWNELLEFDASEEPPSVLDVEVFDFDGPFGKAVSLGHAEINFLKHSSTELADMWITLEGNLALSTQPKLHLRIFLDNTNGVDTIKDYLSRMEKEVGTKLNLRSLHSNSSFQKLFGLPPEEFLIKDFLCSLRRKMPLQGRLFLSARIVGFYTNLFGHKTKFYFLWEDIEDIHVLPPSLGSVGSPSIAIILHKDRGIDARHGAKSQDEEGRLHFYFHSFLSFNEASRTVIALWRSRSQPPDEKDEISEPKDEEDDTAALVEDAWPYVVEDVKLSKVLSIELAVDISKLMQMFDGGKIEYEIMSKSGCLNYITTAWQPAADTGIMERHISYKFNRFISVFGGEITCTQQKGPMPNKDDGWILNDIMTIHNVPFSNYFRVHLKYEIVSGSGPGGSNGVCHCCVYVGVTWLKNTKFEQRITKNIVWMFTRWSKKILELAEKETALHFQ